MDLAFESFGYPTKDWSPNTQSRLEAFLRENSKVVENTVQLRLLQARYEDIDTEVAERIKQALESLGLARIAIEVEKRD